MKTQAILFLLSILLVTACKKSPTGGGDTTPPEVVQTSPENNVSDVSVDTDINVTFNEEIDRDSFVLSVQDSTGNEIEVSSQFEKSKVTISLESSFNFSTEYIASVTASDLDGNEMDEPYSWSFITEPDTTSPSEEDNTPPSVMSSYPENESTGVSVNTDIQVEFSEKVDESTLSFEVENTTDNSSVTGDITSEDNTYIFNPNNNLDYGIDYQVSITASDTSGNEMSEAYTSTFKTEEESDTEAPVVRDTDPKDEESDVSVTTTVRVEFNEQITDELNFSLESSSGESVEGESEVDVNIFTFTPNNPLESSTTYEASISAVDLAGNSMEESYSWSFTTENQDNNPPEVISTSPENEDVDVSVDTDISISFNEHINSDNSELTLSSDSDENIEGNLSFGENSISFAPSNSLDYSTDYQVQAKATDLNGNETNHSWSFTTADEPDNTPPEVTSTTPEDNATNVSINTNISINLNEPIESGNSQLQLKVDGEDVAGNISFGESSISFSPNSSLEYSKDYDVQAVATDLAGNEMEYDWVFTTEDNPDNTPPTVVSTSPYDGELDVSLRSVTINMSEDINPESVSSDNVWVENDEGERLNYEITVSGSQITLDYPNETPYDYDVIKPSSRYFAHIEGVEDLAGNSLQGSYEWDFVNDLWNASYKHEMRFFGAVSDENSIYFNGTIYEDGFYSFFIAKFNNSGILEWLEELPGYTDTSVDDLPSPVLDKQANELYFFSEKDRVVYFNSMDIQTREVTNKSFSEIDHANKLSGELVVDNNNLYFLWSAGQFGSKMLYKIDKNGNKLDEFDFLNSPAHSLTSNGSNLYIATEHDGSDTIAKLDSETLDLIGLLNIDDYDGVFPTTIKSLISSLNDDKQYITGNYEDKPIITVYDESEENSNSVQFGDIYDSIIGDASLDSEGNIFTLVERQGKASLVKASMSGVIWKQDLDFRVTIDYEPILLEEQGIIFVSNWNHNIDLLSVSDGKTIN